MEEMGLETSSIADQPAYFLTALDQEKNQWICNVLFATTLVSLDFTASDECLEYRFFSKEQALKEDLFENVEVFVLLYNDDQ